MSKEQAWREVETAFFTLCQQMCGFECSCNETLRQVREALYV